MLSLPRSLIPNRQKEPAGARRAIGLILRALSGTGQALLLLTLVGCQRTPAPNLPVEAAARDGKQPASAVVQAPEAISQRETSVRTGAAGGAGSRLRTESWDFGIAAPGAEVRHRYTIRNDSATTWTIKEVTPSCACTLGEFTTRTVKPGETTSLEVAFRPGNRDGQVYQGVMVEFAEATAPYINLVLRGEVRSLLSPAPPGFDFGRVLAGTRPTRSLTLRNYSTRDVALTKITAPDWLHVELKQAPHAEGKEAPRQQWRITAQADVSKFKAGPEAPTVLLETNAAPRDRIVLPVSLEVRAPLEVVPQGLAFPMAKVGQPSQQALLLDVSPELGTLAEGDILLQHPLGEALQVQVLKTASANRFRLLASFQPKKAIGTLHAELEIRVRGKEVPPLRVPISGYVR